MKNQNAKTETQNAKNKKSMKRELNYFKNI